MDSKPAKPLNMLEQLRNNPLFTTDENAENERRQNGSRGNSDHEDDDSNPLVISSRVVKSKGSRTKQAKFKASEFTLKSRNKFVGNIDLAQKVGVDQLRFETIGNDGTETLIMPEDQSQSKQQKPFDRFLSDQWTKPKTIINIDYLNTHMQKAGITQTDAVDDIELELAEDPNRTNSPNRLAANTLELKRKLAVNSLEFVPAMKTETIKRPTPEIPLGRSRSDMVRIFTESMSAKPSINNISKEALSTIFKKKSYKDMFEEKKRKEEEKKKLEEGSQDDDFNSQDAEGDDDSEILDEEAYLNGELDEEENGRQAELDRSNEALESQEAVQRSDLRKKSNQMDIEYDASDSFDARKEFGILEEPSNPIATENPNDGHIEAGGELDTSENDSDDGHHHLSRLKNLKQRKQEIKSAKIQKRMEEKAKLEKLKPKLNREFFEVEAELGSDNEEHDDVVKKIDRNADDEREAGLDVSDEELLDRDEIVFNQEDEVQAHQKFLQDLIDDERREIERVMSRNFLKRAEKQHDNILREEDERKQRLKRLEEMYKFLENNIGDNPIAIDDDKVNEERRAKTFGLDIGDSDDEGPSPTAQKKPYTYKDYMRDMETLLKKHAHKFNNQQKEFFNAAIPTKVNIQPAQLVAKQTSIGQMSMLDLQKEQAGPKQKKVFLSKDVFNPMDLPAVNSKPLPTAQAKSSPQKIFLFRKQKD
jgi:hypothetical protein